MRIKMMATFFLLLILALVVPSLATSGVRKDREDSGKQTFTALAELPVGGMGLDLQPDEKGREKGVGTLIYAAQIKVLDGERVDLENFTFAPIKLLGVRLL